MEYIDTLNQALFLKINATSSTAIWMIKGAIFIAKIWIYLIPILLVGLWLWGDERKRELVLKTFLVTLCGLGVSQIIGWLWPSPRPFMIGLGQVWLVHAANFSFPSDHTIVFACVGFTFLFTKMFKTAVLILFIGLCVAWSRVYLGIHFPIDILGGIFVALFAYTLINKIWLRIGKRVTLYLIQCYRFIMVPIITKGWIKY